MAEAILFDMSKSILSQLSSRAIKEIGVWWNAADELNKLEDTVTTIQAVLLDAEEEDQPSHQFKHWLGKLRHFLYDAEELVDDFSTEALRRQVMKENVALPKEVRLFFSRSNQFVFGYNLGRRIKAVRKSLDAVANDRQKFHFKVRKTKRPFLSQEKSQTITFKHREHLSVQREGNVIGRESDKNAIIDILLKSDAKDRLSVLPIVGTGGLGKTTLAKLVHDDENVKSHFDVRIWVFVGDVDLSIKEIEEKALKSAVYRNSNLLRDSKVDVKKGFKGLIDGNKFLLVLDDIWSEDRSKLVDLENLWREGTLESRIIVTTRSSNVANMIGNLKPYRLGYLSLEHARDLFINIVFKGQKPENKNIENSANQILKKCAGVPLAIKTMGNLLHSLNPETEWLPFVRSELSKYPQANNDIFPTLRLSYDHLSSPLKYCFTFCKLFPKGYEINVKTLVQLWIAQGYIKPSDLGENLEDIGLRYCNDLVSRSFFEEKEIDEGKLISCRMHDIMHDLACFLGDDMIVVTSKSLGKNLKKNTHHVSIDVDDFNEPFTSLEFLESLLQARKLRTFISSMWKNEGSVFNGLEVDQCNKICKKLQSLLVLELSDNEIKKIPNSISNLKHLRYLDFSRSRKIKKLPNCITRLINLQVLKLCHCESLEELPKDINKLINLKHLDCEGCDRLKYMPSGLGQMTLLQTLTLFVVGAQNQNQSSCASPYPVALKELSQLNSLTGSLEIRGVKYISEYKAADMDKKQLLQSLSVDWVFMEFDDKNVDDDYNKMSLQNFPLPPNLKKLSLWYYNCQTFPIWPHSLSHLVELDLRRWRRCKHLPPLDQIPHLRVIEIVDFGNLEYMEIFGSGPTFFPSLERLQLDNCKKMKGWRKTAAGENNTSATSITTELPQSSCLFNLEIYDCPNLNLETIPIPSKLQNLKVDGNEVATTFPNWVSSLTNLVEINLNNFKSCKHLPPLDQIPHLRVIKFVDFGNLEYMEIFGSGPTFFPSLERLHLSSCEKMKGWRKTAAGENNTSATSITTELPQFSCLSNLSISLCPNLNLETIPIPSKLQNLKVNGNIVATTFPNWLSSLTNLVEIHLSDFKGCEHLPPLDQIPTLQIISIYGFDNLEHIEIFGRGPTFFPSLNTLRLHNCGNLKGWRKKGEHDDDTSTTTSTADLPQFLSLSQLTIDNCPLLILESFLHQIPSLQQLQISNFPDLDYFEIGGGPTFFPSLNTLNLHNCGKLKGWRKKGEHHDDTSTTTSTADLPQFLSLSDLTIDNCPLLIWESFPPTPKLNKMMVSRYEVISFPRCWLPSLLTNTVKIQLKKWRRCKYLPPLDQIPSLQQLKISDFDDLEYIEFGSGPTFFSSLKKLKLSSCQNLKGWRKEGDEDMVTEEQLPQFPCLSKLRIRNCPNLSSMPLFPTLDEELELRNVNKERLVRSLSNLKRLFIAEIEDLQSLPTEWLRNLISLQSLRIRDCPSLTHLPQEMQRLTSLQELIIWECPQLKERCGNNKGVDWPNIAHISNIQIDWKDIQVGGHYQLHNRR